MTTLFDCYLPIFKMVTKFSYQTENFIDYEQFRLQCVTFLEQAVIQAEYLDVSDFERDKVFFAVVVWLDEKVLCSTWQLQHRWRDDLLQRKYFQTTVGGEGFFSHLNQLKEEHWQARWIFLFCLQNGFHGKYNSASDSYALEMLIAQQQQLCLPENWQVWPNNAEITPIKVNKSSVSISCRRRLGIALTGTVLLYGMFLFFQMFYY